MVRGVKGRKEGGREGQPYKFGFVVLAILSGLGMMLLPKRRSCSPLVATMSPVQVPLSMAMKSWSVRLA